MNPITVLANSNTDREPWLFVHVFVSSIYLCIKCTHLQRGSIDGWGATLQAVRLWIRVPVRSFNFFSLPNPFGCTMTLGFTQPLTEMSTRKKKKKKNSGVKRGRRVRLTTWPPSVSHLSIQCGIHYPPRVAGGGNCLQIWRVAANQSRAAYNGWSFSYGVGCGASNFSPWKISLLRNVTKWAKDLYINL
jgi:hypothetical protein